jgi:hypothetical protein
MVTSQIYDHGARLRSFNIVAEVRDTLASSAVGSGGSVIAGDER